MRVFARERKAGYSIRICLVSPLGMGTGSAKRAQQKVYLDETGGIGLGGMEGSVVSLNASLTGMGPREHLLDLGARIKQLMREREIRKERSVGATGDGGGEREAAAGVLLLTGEETGEIDLDK